MLSAHPDSDLWLRPPAEASSIEWHFGFIPDAYERAGDRTTGAEFIVVITGEIMTMPGLPKSPSSERIFLNDLGQIEGLF